MVWYAVAVVDFLVYVFSVCWKTVDKDLEILLLRQQLRVPPSSVSQPRECPPRGQRVFLRNSA